MRKRIGIKFPSQYLHKISTLDSSDCDSLDGPESGNVLLWGVQRQTSKSEWNE